jgi:hypothetical protein
MWEAMKDPGSSLGEHYGLLEINLDRSGYLHDYRGSSFTLHNVGPLVRSKLRTLSQVRAVPMNKIVRCLSHHNPPHVLGSFGYVRVTDWPLEQDLLIKLAEIAQDTPMRFLQEG